MRRTHMIICAGLVLYGMAFARPLLAQVAEQDSLALVALYNSTNGAEWNSSDGWLSAPVSEWYGITVADGRVTEIDLGDNNLSGPLPAEIGDLTACEQFHLWENNLTGSIPVEVGNMVRCNYLNLRYNQLTGTIPSSIGNMTSLIRLRLNSNQLTGSIPKELGNCIFLRFLYLNVNELSGSIPPELGALTTLESIQLNQNNLTGEIPAEMGNLVNLTGLYLHLNDLTGELPSELGNLTRLQYLNINSNELEGSIPPELGNCTQLNKLNLWGNRLDGSLPEEITQCSMLEEIWVYDNRLTGLPDLTAIDSLRDLRVGENQLTFEDLEPHVGIANFDYTPQADIGMARDTLLQEGDALLLTCSVGGTANHYQWVKNGELIPDAAAGSLSIAHVTEDDEGSYVCRITNTLLPALTISTRPVQLRVDAGTGARTATSLPQQPVLGMNYPNPFAAYTTIPLQLASGQHIRLEVCDLLGRPVRTLVDGPRGPGNVPVLWDGCDEAGRRLPRGAYLLRISAPSLSEVRTLMLQR